VKQIRMSWEINGHVGNSQWLEDTSENRSLLTALTGAGRAFAPHRIQLRKAPALTGTVEFQERATRRNPVGADPRGLMRTKASFFGRITEVIERKGLTQAEAAAVIGMSVAEFSRLQRGHFHLVSEQRLRHSLFLFGLTPYPS